ncbi:synaptotagmin-like protein 2 [Heteronotia binoei]|uniref:synaptotagmin-like protein 2 n=1 Tax=Heteronotia binoei TaxID=13085 RepID=UPI00292F78C7|nr:synaptotagmin-like protein 2 [Heteronotia binoei]
MIDLSFLTDEEQEAILKVLQRDADLKRAEEARIRHLPEKVKDDNQVKNMSGQWFYEAKSKRHRDKIHGADLIRASMRRKPLTVAELNQNKSGRKKNSWVNNVDKEVFTPPEPFGALEETEGESKSSLSPTVFSRDTPQEDTKKAAVSPSKERKNPFNNSNLSEDDAKSQHSERGISGSSEASKKDSLLPSVENQPGVNIRNKERAFVELNEPQRQAGKPPIPRARKNVHKTSDASVKSDDSFPKVPQRIKSSNGQGTLPRGILKRNSSSSSTDSEVLRLSQTVDPPYKNGIPTSTILEGVADKNSPPRRDLEGFSQNSLERAKQVRFSSSVSRKERPPSLELREGKESGEFGLLDSDDRKTSNNQVSGLNAHQNEQTSPTNPLVVCSTDLNGHVEHRAVPKEGTVDPNPYNTNGTGRPSDTLQSQKSPPAESSDSSSKIFPKVVKEPSIAEAKPEIKAGQRSLVPDITASSAGQQLPLANTEDPQAASAVSKDLEQGKPVPVDGPNAKTPSRSDRHAAEASKAADESISKVLDWFKRSSSTDSEGTVSLSASQGREPLEETSVPKTRELAITREENGPSRVVLNEDTTLHERKELTKEDPRFHDGGNQPELHSLAQMGYPSGLLLEEQRLGNQGKEREVADLSDQGNVHFLIASQGTDNANKRHFWEEAVGESKMGGENVVSREPKVTEGVKLGLNLDSSAKERETGNNTQPDGERSVKSYVQKGNFEHPSGVLLKGPEGRESSFLEKGTAQQDADSNRGDPFYTQPQEIKEASPPEDRKKVKDIRAFWEREQTSPRVGNKEDLLSASANVNKATHSYNRGSSRAQPARESSGYVTSESDSEQGKYNLVTFRRVELSDDSESQDNDLDLSSESIRPEPLDKSKRGHVVIRSSETLPSDWKSTGFTESLDADNLRPRHATFSSKKEGLQTSAKDKTSSALPQKPNFVIHSLKEKVNEESKSEMLNPSQFRSLRSFWDAGVKPQDRTDKAKETRIPISHSLETSQPKSKEIKGGRVGTGQAFLEEEQKSQVTQGFLKATPSQPFLANVVPKRNLQFVPKEDGYLLELADSKPMEMRIQPGKEVEEYIEKTAALSKMQPILFNSGLQKLLTQTSQDSLPVDLLSDERGAPKETEGQTHDIDHIVQHGGVPADMDSNVGPSVSEIAETVHRTQVPPKVGADSFNVGIERLLKETLDGTPASDGSGAVSTSKQPPPVLEKRGFYNKVMQLSHDAYPTDQTKRDVVPQSLGKRVSTSDQNVKFETTQGNVLKETEDLNPGPWRALHREENPKHLDISSQKEVLQIPSPAEIPLDPHLAVLNSPKSPGEEVSETVSESRVPLKRESHDLKSRLLVLLKEFSELPSVSRSTESILKNAFGSTLREDQQTSYKQVMETSTLPSSEVTHLSRQASRETTEKSNDIFNRIQGEPDGETAMKSNRVQPDDPGNGDVTSVGELVEPQAKKVSETVVKTVKANSLEPTRFKDSLLKLLKEDSQVLFKDIEFPKPVHPSLYSSQSVSSVYDKGTPPSQEIHEFVEKATAPSNSIYDKFKINFQKLLIKDTEFQPAREESTNDNKVKKATNDESEPNQDVDSVGQQDMDLQEIEESVNKTVVPSKLQQSELNSGLQRLLAEVSPTSPVEIQELGGKLEGKMQASQGVEETVGLSQDSVLKSAAPADDTVFDSETLKKENPDASSQLSKERNQEVPDDSSSLSKNGSLSVTMPGSLWRASDAYRTEVKIPLKGKNSKQDGQGLADATIIVVPGKKTFFQKTVQANLLSTETPLPGKEAVSPTHAEAEEREAGFGRDRDSGEVSRTSLTFSSGSGEMDVPLRSQRASTPLTEQETPPRVSQFELILAARYGGDHEDEDSRSFGSDFSDESINSLAEIKRSSTSARTARGCVHVFCLKTGSAEDPVLEALKRSSNRQIPSKSLEDIPSATSNEGKVNTRKEDLMLSAEDVSTAPSFPVNQFSNPEKIKRMSKSVPTFLQEESDERETDTASDSSHSLGRIKKSPSSLTNLSGSSGLASLSSVSTSVMSVYSGDFGNVDVKGNIQFAIDYVEQLKELHVFIAQCKDLAVADIKKNRSDPYVKIYLLPEKYKLGKRKTSVKKKTLNPAYNEILRYKVDKALLASQRLNISVWHNDIFGRNSFLGEVDLDLNMWDWNDKHNKQMIWYPLKPRAPLAALELESRGEMKLALQYIPHPVGGKKPPATGEVHIWVKECSNLPILRGNKLNSFVKCTILPDTSRKSRQKTRAMAKTTNPVFNHTMVYDGFKPEDLKEACAELTVWDHNKLVNHFVGGLRIGLGTGKSYGTTVDWMDSTLDETSLWERMISSPDQWIEDTLPLRMLTIAKIAK